MSSFSLKFLGQGCLLLCLGLVLSSCGRDGDDPAQRLLRAVPADTPYLFANLEPLPDATQDKLLRGSRQMLNQYRNLLGRMAEDLEQQPGDEIEQAQAKQAMTTLHAMLDYALEGMSPEKMVERGLKPDGHMVLYGHGILPSARIEIADQTKVEGELRRLEARFGTTESQRYQDQSYRRVVIADKLVFLYGTTTQDLILSFVPLALEQDYLPLLFGDQVPKDNLADDDRLARLNQRFGFTPYGSGYVDLVRLTETFAGQAGGEHLAVLQAMAPDFRPPSPGCAQLAKNLVSEAPRLSFGYREISTERLATRAVWETSASVAAYIKDLAYPIPAMGRATDATFSFGLSLNLPKAREALKALLSALAEQGKDCADVDQDGLKQAGMQVDMMLNPIVASFKGLYFEADRVELDPANGMPADLSAQAIAVVDDPRGIFALSGMANPELASLDVPTDGTPVAIPADILPPPLPAMHVAIQGKGLALAAGGDSAKAVETLLRAATVEPAPIYSYSVNYPRLVQLLESADELTRRMAAQAGEDMDDQLAMQMDLYKAAAEFIQITRASLHVAPEGLVFDEVMTLR